MGRFENRIGSHETRQGRQAEKITERGRERKRDLANFRGQGYDIRLCPVFLSREHARESAQQALSLSKAVCATYLGGLSSPL